MVEGTGQAQAACALPALPGVGRTCSPCRLSAVQRRSQGTVAVDRRLCCPAGHLHEVLGPTQPQGAQCLCTCALLWALHRGAGFSACLRQHCAHARSSPLGCAGAAGKLGIAWGEAHSDEHAAPGAVAAGVLGGLVVLQGVPRQHKVARLPALGEQARGVGAELEQRP